ncbi:DUF3576 domain-containing protein [Alkalicaulis satelles]|uniref:DUF3576 domain-containing protein n=1 Tax=Alkalicaulis satelles TaxID=2609175 RepID=A0A5M6ZII2_9PROT|nr:DUF3576 domain-containing protein [Alkalicaulis satelles]KAA5803845.1 DUF3576 domain-containing protein [Alkalicaulis satelles]
MTLKRLTFLTAAALGCAVALSACGTRERPSDASASAGDRGFLGGVFNRGAPRVDDGSEAGIGVNSLLWRASLEVLHFMPMAEVDPFGGVIITDWYAIPEAPSERFRATVYILDTRLRADALTVQLFKQVRGETGEWVEANIDPATQLQVENAILTRARQLRIQRIPG